MKGSFFLLLVLIVVIGTAPLILWLHQALPNQPIRSGQSFAQPQPALEPPHSDLDADDDEMKANDAPPTTTTTSLPSTRLTTTTTTSTTLTTTTETNTLTGLLHPRRASSTPVIALEAGMTNWLGKHMLRMPSPCPVTCQYLDGMPEARGGSEQAREDQEADMYIVHAPSHIGLSQYRKQPGQIWGVFSLEPQCIHSSLGTIAKNPLIDFEMSYRLRSRIWAPYVSGKPTTLARLRRPVPMEAKNATAPVAVFISNCNSHGRISYIKDLMQWIPVHSYGSCLNNAFADGPRNHITKLRVLENYKFYLAFENCVAEDYVSEKVFDGLYANTLPIYMGAPNVRNILPSPDAALYVDDFSSPKNLADYLHYLNSNDAAYEAHFAWKKKPYQESFSRLINVTKLDSRCRVCMWLHTFEPFCRQLNATQLVELQPPFNSPIDSRPACPAAFAKKS